MSPENDQRVAIRLVGHPFTYAVRVTTDTSRGPVLTELSLVADDGSTVDYAATRAVPVRRLAHTAHHWINQQSRPFALPDDINEGEGWQDESDPRPFNLADLAELIEQAVMDGRPVRPALAAHLGVGKRTVDRMISKARGLGLLDGVVIPKRPSPQQRDWLIARNLAERWLAENGPEATPPPELLDEIDRLRGQTKKRGPKR